MTDGGIGHIGLFDLGIGSADLIAALAKAGCHVTVIEPDQSDAERVATVLQRRLVGVEFEVTSQHSKDCDLFMCRAAHAHHAPQAAITGIVDGPVALLNVSTPDRTVAVDLSDLRLVEIAFGTASDQTRQRLTQLLDQIAARWVGTPGRDMFAGAGLQDQTLAMIDRLLLSGQTPWELDEALEEAGFDDGFLKAQDQIGLEVAFARRRAAGMDLLVADRMVREGRLGRSVGVGWYRYPGGGGAVIDPLMEDMIVEEAHFARVPQCPMSDSAAARALICGVINRAATLLADPAINRASLDALVRVKLGLPDVTRRAREIGQDALRRELAASQRIDPGLWAPCKDLHVLF